MKATFVKLDTEHVVTIFPCVLFEPVEAVSIRVRRGRSALRRHRLPQMHPLVASTVRADANAGHVVDWIRRDVEPITTCETTAGQIGNRVFRRAELPLSEGEARGE